MTKPSLVRVKKGSAWIPEWFYDIDVIRARDLEKYMMTVGFWQQTKLNWRHNIMGTKRSRAKKTSSGVRKSRALENTNHPSRKRHIADPGQFAFLREQATDRWPEQHICDKYAKLNQKKRHPSRVVCKPSRLGFPLMEQAYANSAKAVEILVTAACLTIKRVKRHPGWILQTTYNMKNRPIEII